MQKEPITDYGFKKVVDELDNLKKIERPETLIELDIARSHGDLKENAEYHAAKEKLAFMDIRMAELANLIAKVQVIDPSTYPHNKIKFGSTIKLKDLDIDKEIEYTIVGAFESNPHHGLISIKTPLAKQLLGKEEGDEIIVQLPRGEVNFEVLEVYFKPIEFGKNDD